MDNPIASAAAIHLAVLVLIASLPLSGSLNSFRKNLQHRTGFVKLSLPQVRKGTLVSILTLPAGLPKALFE
jgi:hypothetical protein